MDLIVKCFEKPGTIFWVQERMEKLQDASTRDQIVIAELRSTSPYLPSVSNPEKAAIGKGPIASWPIEPFRSVIKKWLPNEPLEAAVMNTPEARAVLADKLEAAIAGLPAPESKPLGQGPKYADLSVKKFTDEVDATWDGSIHREKIRAALSTGRADLIRACIEHNRTRGYFEEELIKFPDGPEKKAILLLLLRTHDDLWRSFDYPYMGPRPITARLKEPFSSFIQKYLPDHPMDDSQVTNREARLDLCDRLEAAMTGKPLPPKKRPPQSPPISQKENLPPPSPDKAGTGNSPDASATNIPVPALWIIAAGALGAISLVWWMLKKQK